MTTIGFGGDYNPEQWPREIWDEDVRLMQSAGVTMATVGVFSWSRLEPSDGVFDFEWLDDVIGRLHEGGIAVDLATATATPPPWLTHAHPEILPVTEDGTTLSPGSRQQYCPSSPVFRRYADRLVRALADRYGTHPAVQLWHVSNEYGCHVSRCYCNASAAAFRSWLRDRYGDIASLNNAWGTDFWGQRYSSFDEILPPRTTPAFKNPTQLLDWERFGSHALLECYRAEARILRAVSPLVPITTNFMGLFSPADYWSWAREIDVISDDSYPDPADPTTIPVTKLTRDLMRSLGGGKPWMLLEQSTSYVNWRHRNAIKAPGQMRALSYQAIAHGCRSINFFQWRQSVVGAEQFHSAMLPHSGTDTRVWREVEALGAELAELGPRLDAPENDRSVEAAIVLDWDSWWAIEQPARSTVFSYIRELQGWYDALSAQGVRVRFVPVDADLSQHPLVIVPTLYVCTDEVLAGLAAYVRGGGRLVVTYQSAIADQNLHIRRGGYLGVLQDTLGLWIEEFTPLSGPGPVAAGEAAPEPVTVAGDLIRGEGSEWAEVVRVRDAEVRATFHNGPAAGGPAVTENQVGTGSAWYVATALDPQSRQTVAALVAAQAGLATAPVPDGVEIVRDGDITAVINHRAAPYTLEIDGTDLLSGASTRGLTLDIQGVAFVHRGEE